MNRMMICLVALFLLVGVLVVPLKVHGDYTGTITIHMNGTISPSDAPIQVNGTTYSLTDNISPSGDGIVSERGYIVLDGRGFKLTGNQNGTGIVITGHQQVLIENMTIENFGTGIHLDSCSRITISHNIVADNYYSIWLSNSGNNNISDNIVGSDSFTGIYLTNSSSTTICDNHVESDAHYGIRLAESSNYNRVYENNITQNYIEGLAVEDSYNDTVSNNTILGNFIEGLELLSDFNCTVYGNDAKSNDYGILLNGGLNNTIFDNQISGSAIDGISMLWAQNYTIYQNNITACNNGFRFSSMGETCNNTIFANNIMNNSNGIAFDFTDPNNKFYHNNFINNTAQIVEVNSPYSGNIWDNGFEGNYWSDYNGTDNNQDGIGDTPYIIAANNTDHYPLMGTFQSFNVPSNNPPYNLEEIEIISNSTIGKVQIWENFEATTYKWFIYLTGISGKEGTSGFCRITFPNDIINSSYYPIYVGSTLGNSTIIKSNGTYTTLYFTYSNPAYEIEVIPEFPSFLILPLFFITTLLATIFLRKRLIRS